MQSLRLWQKKKKCYLAPKKRDVGVIAWTLERERFLPHPPPPRPSLPPPSASPFLYQLARSSRNAISDWFITSVTSVAKVATI